MSMSWAETIFAIFVVCWSVFSCIAAWAIGCILWGLFVSRGK
jgi:hypothetical protein